jgi:hypothetical protein
VGDSVIGELDDMRISVLKDVRMLRLFDVGKPPCLRNLRVLYKRECGVSHTVCTSRARLLNT